MSPAPARAWWAEVEHLREAAERRHGEPSRRERQSSPGEPFADRQRPARVEANPRSEAASGPSPAQRRTVRIRGQVIPTAPARPLHEAGDAELDAVVVAGPWVRQVPSQAHRRPRKRVSERVGPRPDRIALWAFVVGLLLVVIAAATAHGATPSLAAHAHAALGALQLPAGH